MQIEMLKKYKESLVWNQEIIFQDKTNQNILQREIKDYYYDVHVKLGNFFFKLVRNLWIYWRTLFYKNIS